MKSLLRIIGVVCIGILFLHPGMLAAQDLDIGNYSLISKERVGRTAFDFTYRAQVTNSGPDVQNVTATLISNSPYTTIVDGSLTFGDLGIGETKTSIDTFTICQDRRYPFSWDNLHWDITFQSGTLILTLDYANSVSTEITPAGGTLSTTGSDGKLYTLTFPPDALNEAQEIVLTPIMHIEGLPIGRNVLAAVHAAPSGLQLVNPATLTIEPLPTLADGTIPVGLLVEDDGQTYKIRALDIEGNRGSVELLGFTLQCMVEMFLPDIVKSLNDKYYGNDGIIDQLTQATSCNDAALAKAANLVQEIQVLYDTFGVDEDLVAFTARDCIYPLGEGNPPCSTFNDFRIASMESLENRIREIFREKDDACKADPEKELEALQCIAIAGLLSDETTTVYDEQFDFTLFKEKTCGLFELQVVPDEVHLTVGGNDVLEATAKDKDGNELYDREFIWKNDYSDLVEMNVNANTAQITAKENGVATIEVWDKLYIEAGQLTEWGLNRIFSVIGCNYTTPDVYIGRYVKINPDQVSILPSELDIVLDTLKATLHASDGRKLPPTGFTWQSSDEEVVSVESYGSYDSEGILTAKGIGVATISAYELSSGSLGKADVIVGAKMNVEPAHVCLAPFQWQKLSATVEDLFGEPVSGINPYYIVWFSPANSIASVSIDGVVIAQSVGEVQIEATYGNFLTGFSTISVPEFDPINFKVTPVYSPPYVTEVGGILKYSMPNDINDNRQVVNVYEEAVNVKEICGVSEEMPEKVITNHNGLFAYSYIEGRDVYAYVFDSSSCEEYEIPVPPDAYPQAINAEGRVVGVITSSSSYYGFDYDFKTGGVGYYPRSYHPIDINNKGEVLISRPDGQYIFYQGIFTELSDDVTWRGINDHGVVIGNYTYWDDDWNQYRDKGAIDYHGRILKWDPPFPDTIPAPRNWQFIDINNQNDILIFSAGLDDYSRQVMHLCPLE